MANNIYIQNFSGSPITIFLAIPHRKSGALRSPLRTCSLLVTLIAGLLKIALALAAGWR